MSWPVVSLRTVATLARDGVAPEDISSGTLFVGLENIKRGGDFERVEPVDNGEIASTKFSFSPKHVLYGKLRPYLAKIALPDFEGVCSTDIIPIMPGPKLDRRYLAHYLLTPRMVALASDRATGANLPRLSPRVLLEFPIPLPPLDEQRRIAAILDQAEELRAKRRAAIALLDQLPESIFIEVFGDPVVNSYGHPRVQFEEVLHPDRGTKCGPFGSALKKHEYVSDGVPVWQIDNVGQLRFIEEKALYITPDKFRHLSSYSVVDGDILITRAGTVGKICVAHPTVEHSMIGTNLIRVSLDLRRAHSEFVAFLLALFGTKLGSLRANAKEDAYSFMKTGVLRSLRIPLPPLGLQRQFAARVEAIHRAKAAHQTALTELDALFASLQDQCFGGIHAR